MGKRSRKRGVTAPPAEPVAAVGTARPPRARTRKARLDEAPKAPWSPFPLNELCVLIGFVLLLVGFFSGETASLFAGLGLVGLATTELSVREHFSGYRSHSSLLAGIAALAFMIALELAVGPPRVGLLVGGAVVFGLSFTALRRAFMERSGGFGFRA